MNFLIIIFSITHINLRNKFEKPNLQKKQVVNLTIGDCLEFALRQILAMTMGF